MKKNRKNVTVASYVDTLNLLTALTTNAVVAADIAKAFVKCDTALKNKERVSVGDIRFYDVEYDNPQKHYEEVFDRQAKRLVKALIKANQNASSKDKFLEYIPNSQDARMAVFCELEDYFGKMLV